jgi:hypothetical protein
LIVAKITKDYLDNNTSKQFEFEAMPAWWGWEDFSLTTTELKMEEAVNGKTHFKLYDDDKELYFEGWLLNDNECLVQQFVLDWAKADAGCTEIHVQVDGKYIQEVG